MSRFPLPDANVKRGIFRIHSSRMNLSEDVNLEEVRDMRALVGLTDLLARVTSQYVMMKDEMSGADIKAMCTEVS